MKRLLHIFKYIQKYHEDNFDVLYLTLEFLLLAHNTEVKEALLKQRNKTQALAQFHRFLESLSLDYMGFHLDLNYQKILKSLQDFNINADSLGEFIQAITMQKTILKFYEYATPVEINALVCKILDIKQGESVYNPCCGLGSWLLHLNAHLKGCTFYGVDIEEKLIRIAKIIAHLLGLKQCVLSVGNVFNAPYLTEFKYDKIFCHPPLLNHLNVKAPKESPLAPYNKTALEIPFLDHSLMRFKKKVVCIIRTSLLSKGAGERLWRYLLQSSLLEAVIELPDNIFPYKAESHSLLVLSHLNKRALFINARSFSIKEGKYHKLINTEELLDLYFSKQNTSYSTLLDYVHLTDGIRPSTLKTQNHAQTLLGELLECAYRGVRIASRSDSDLIACYDFGIKDFNPYGFSNIFNDYVLRAKHPQLQKLKIKPYDVLLSMRGILPKIAIIGEQVQDKIVLPNAGILVLRFKNIQFATALYFYFLSKKGQQLLNLFYLNHNERVGEKDIKMLEIPTFSQTALETYNAKFTKLCADGESIAKHTQNIKSLLDF